MIHNTRSTQKYGKLWYELTNDNKVKEPIHLLVNRQETFPSMWQQDSNNDSYHGKIPAFD